mmetsp:Transcript_19330/g.32329  ORF Transcript_19330/g.32329 Transcript_19330/m.32329 type:complete len:275 (-) Transcript_19330:253-1077(-)|eukprot:CAMPEP_0119328212 /NCGR_PEP_ID=MMETSP1333-20130426/72750_1 /TAXON_ID=418940 /ORGANISM="Scyphosphaera apsteinii, Strain RCC1455" /LENGTH=274 /DNA_ID=CAMNT_0007337003 /DNA_START=66 /DNA_END=890 /DNA_ORIENTATION=+
MKHFAIIAASDTGSTWLNHVLASHLCISSAGEYLMNRPAELQKFHSGHQSRLLEVLKNIENHNRPSRYFRCNHTAGGVKLKAIARDVTHDNAAQVAKALRERKWKVIQLDRHNGLEHMLGAESRAKAPGLHCKSSCNAFDLNFSATLNCHAAISHIRNYESARQEIDRHFTHDTLKVRYELLLSSSHPWHAMMVHLGFRSVDACMLQSSFQKRVKQTQREMIRNYNEIARCLTTAGYSRFLRPDHRPSDGPLPRDVEPLCRGCHELTRLASCNG